MKPSSSGEQTATYFDFYSNTYTNIPNYILMYLFSLDLSRTEWKLYLYLRSKKNNNNGLAWPGVRATVREARISKKDVKPARDRLEALGLISTTTRPGETTLIEFNDEQLKHCTPTEGYTRRPPTGGHTLYPSEGPQTITNTSTIVTTTNGKGNKKNKKVKSVTPRSAKRPSPGAKPSTKGVYPSVGDTTQKLLKQKTKPTYEQYLKAKGNQWEWRSFLAKWEALHSKKKGGRT
jgi:hypothetical protein